MVQVFIRRARLQQLVEEEELGPPIRDFVQTNVLGGDDESGPLRSSAMAMPPLRWQSEARQCRVSKEPASPRGGRQRSWEP